MVHWSKSQRKKNEMPTPSLRFRTPLQIKVLAQVYRGDTWKRLERYIGTTIQANAALVGVGPITLNVTKWRKEAGLIAKAVKALDEYGWNVQQQKDKKHHYIFVTEKLVQAPPVQVTVTKTQAATRWANPTARRSSRR